MPCCCPCRLQGQFEEQFKSLQTKLDKAQQTASEAVKSARKAENECIALQKQNASLRDRMKDIEHRQQVRRFLRTILFFRLPFEGVWTSQALGKILI